MNVDAEILNSNILLVDDKDINIQILERYLEENGFTSVQSSTDPREGLKIFKEGNIDLVLLDLKMPGMSGFEFMESIKSKKDDFPLPVLILTANSDQDAIARSFELGAADYITKPFMEMEVITRMINLLRVFDYRKKIKCTNEILEKKVRERTADLLKTQGELERFIFSASHDFQEPLRKIITFGGQLEELLIDPTKDQVLYISKLQKATFRMKTMVDDLLGFTRHTLMEKNFERIDLNEIAKEVLNDLEPQMDSTRASVDLSNLPELEADKVQIRLLFQNLIINGLKYMKPHAPPKIKIGSFPGKKNSHCIIFEDNGIGFDNKYKNLIFEPFKRLHSEGEIPGTGLGLFLCEKIVAGHNGTITAKSILGQGSTFIVELPESHIKEN